MAYQLDENPEKINTEIERLPEPWGSEISKLEELTDMDAVDILKLLVFVFLASIQIAMCLIPFIFLAFVLIRSSVEASQIIPSNLPSDTKRCCVCDAPQNPAYTARCMECGQYYCNYPPSLSSPREKLDSAAGVIGVILFCALTAVSFIGGVIAIAFLIIPYLLFREIIPNTPPAYQKRCGGDVYDQTDDRLLGQRCNNCGGPLPKSIRPVETKYVSSGASSIGSDSSYGGSDSSSSTYDPYADYRQDTSSSSNEESTGSLWDGWLFKYGDDSNDNRDDDD